jgi:hypothetical protein
LGFNFDKSSSRSSLDGRFLFGLHFVQSQIRGTDRPFLLHFAPSLCSFTLLSREYEGRCQAKMPNGKTCGDAKWIDVHHVIEVANGGPTTPENLITLCRAHHRMWHDDHTRGTNRICTNRIRDRQKEYCA